MAAAVVAIVLTAWMQAGGFAQQQENTPAQAGPIDTSLCEIVKAPLSFHRKLVRISSYASAGGIDTGPMLYDPACAVCPELPTVTNDYQMRRLREYFAVPFTMPTRRHLVYRPSIKGTFVGEVEYWLTTDGENLISLKLHEVSDLVIELPKKR
jgi:hypothetical protein